MRGIRECYERSLGGVEYLMRGLRDRTGDMERINITEREISSELEGTILELLEEKYYMEVR